MRDAGCACSKPDNEGHSLTRGMRPEYHFAANRFEQYLLWVMQPYL